MVKKMRIKFELTQLDSHAHLNVYTSESNDLKASMGQSGTLCMTHTEWEVFKQGLIARFGASQPTKDEYIFVIAK